MARAVANRSKTETPASVRKPTGVVEISEPEGKLTLADRQLWNHLLACAWKTLGQAEWHSVNMSDIRRFAAEARGGAGENDNRRLKDSVIRLQETTVQYNYLDNDSGVWESSQLLGTCRYREREQTLEFTFPVGLRERLQEPALYSIINLRIQYAFDSKYGLVLYEVLRRYADLRAEKPFWKVETARLRDLLGCREKLPDYKDFRRRAIDPAVAEIGRLSEFTVEVEEHRHGRGRGGGTVVGLTFWITRKDAEAARDAISEIEKPRIQRRGEQRAAQADGEYLKRVARAITWLSAADLQTRKKWAERAEVMGVKLPRAAMAPDNIKMWAHEIADTICDEEGLR